MSKSSSRGGRWTLAGIDKARGKSQPANMSIKQFQAATEPKLLETDIQQKLFEKLAEIPYRGTFLTKFFYAVPNGGYRTKRTGGILKAEGLKKGVPDIHCFIAVPPFHSLYIEMKTKTGELSQDQESMISMLRKEGHKVVICRSVMGAIDEIFKYLGISA